MFDFLPYNMNALQSTESRLHIRPLHVVVLLIIPTRFELM